MGVFFSEYSQVIFSLKYRILLHSYLKIEKKQSMLENCRLLHTCNTLGRESKSTGKNMSHSEMDVWLCRLIQATEAAFRVLLL